MASTKIILRKVKKNSKGEYPLYLRTIQNRKTNFFYLGIRLKEEDWDAEAFKVKKSRNNSARLNAYITEKMAQAEAALLDTEKKVKILSAKKLKGKIMGIEPENFYPLLQKYLDRLEKGGQIATFLRARAVRDKLLTYTDQKPLYLDDITPSFLSSFSDHLKVKENNKPNTIHGNLRIIRKVMNDAIREGLLSIDDNPFKTFKLKTEPTKRGYLLESELNTIEGLKLEGKGLIEQVRDLFVFACYAGGIRISDLLVLRWADIQEGHVVLKMQKTRGLQMVKLPDTAQRIIDQLRTDESKPDDFVFPFITDKEEIDSPAKLHYTVGRKTSLINKYLGKIANKAEINKKITFHLSRHTFATLALKKGIPIEYVSKLLGHADLKETQLYTKIINEELDKAMDVFNN
jgi:integrase/recombinase XerD